VRQHQQEAVIHTARVKIVSRENAPVLDARREGSLADERAGAGNLKVEMTPLEDRTKP
jgi:hypothetical protein